jgi:hypothetical protein
VSRRTVESHVSHIVGKLGLTTRAQIAVWAAQHGLLEPQPPKLRDLGEPVISMPIRESTDAPAGKKSGR